MTEAKWIHLSEEPHGVKKLLLTRSQKIPMIHRSVTKLSRCISTMPQSVSPIIGLLLTLLFVVSCQTPLAVKQIQAKNPLAKNAAKTPVEIVDVWNSCAQTTSEGKMMRGMVGRVHFYDGSKKSQAVKVEGDLTVFVFDGNENDPAHTKPIKVFQFEAETLNQHYSHQEPLGHGYNFFLPIDEIGGEEKPLCIMVRFDDKLNDTKLDDMPLMAQPVNTILAGRKPQTPAESTVKEFLESRSLLAETNRTTMAQNDSSIQQAGYISEINNADPEKPKVATIPLNTEMTKRLIEVRETAPVSMPW